MIFHSIISLSFAEGTERILRYTSLSYLQRTCITIMSCWCNVCRGLNIERMLSSHSWRGACLISLHFSAYLIRLSYQESQKATESLPGFFPSSFLSFLLLGSCWEDCICLVNDDVQYSSNIPTRQQWVFHALLKTQTHPRPTTAILVKSFEWY